MVYNYIYSYYDHSYKNVHIPLAFLRLIRRTTTTTISIAPIPPPAAPAIIAAELSPCGSIIEKIIILQRILQQTHSHTSRDI